MTETRVNIPLTISDIEKILEIAIFAEVHSCDDHAPSLSNILDIREKFEYWLAKTYDWGTDVG